MKLINVDHRALNESDFDLMWAPWLKNFFSRSYTVGSRAIIHLFECWYIGKHTTYVFQQRHDSKNICLKTRQTAKK
jgi:hypothetical protein